MAWILITVFVCISEFDEDDKQNPGVYNRFWTGKSGTEWKIRRWEIDVSDISWTYSKMFDLPLKFSLCWDVCLHVCFVNFC